MQNYNLSSPMMRKVETNSSHESKKRSIRLSGRCATPFISWSRRTFPNKQTQPSWHPWRASFKTSSRSDSMPPKASASNGEHNWPNRRTGVQLSLRPAKKSRAQQNSTQRCLGQSSANASMMKRATGNTTESSPPPIQTQTTNHAVEVADLDPLGQTTFAVAASHSAATTKKLGETTQEVVRAPTLPQTDQHRIDATMAQISPTLLVHCSEEGVDKSLPPIDHNTGAASFASISTCGRPPSECFRSSLETTRDHRPMDLGIEIGQGKFATAGPSRGGVLVTESDRGDSAPKNAHPILPVSSETAQQSSSSSGLFSPQHLHQARTLQDGRLTDPSTDGTSKRLACQMRSEDSVLTSEHLPKGPSICLLSVARQGVLIPYILLRGGPCATPFFQIGVSGDTTTSSSRSPTLLLSRRLSFHQLHSAT
ncbi:hypothetical protein BJV82DRAFT_558549 [Fennellomyces sp. T-0311]|nr:hypothetical protein BJV82DRAFT_558549 [Fennellomyces sp. T-0311]